MSVLRRVARLVIRVAGWLVTPIAATLAAAVGATVASVFAPTVSPMNGLLVTAGGGLVGTVIGLALWLRLVRGSPQLQEALAMTPEGVPRAEAVEELLTGEEHSDSVGTP